MVELKRGSNRMPMMKFMKGCRWCPLIPTTFGIIFFLLAYFLDAETVRVLWLIISGIMILMGLFGLIMMNLMMSAIREQ